MILNDYLSTQKLRGAEELTSDDNSIPPPQSLRSDAKPDGEKSLINEISIENCGDDNKSCIKTKPDDNVAKHSLSKSLNDCQTQSKRGSGWGTPLGLGLRGGGEPSLANGATGWGPPPANRGSGGWGSAPPPNPTAAAAWGAAPSTSVNSISNGNKSRIVGTLDFGYFIRKFV